MGKKIFTLRKPITAHDAELSVLELSEPTPEQVARLGLPYQFDVSGGAMDFKMSVVMKYIAQLSGIPASSVNQLAVPDLQGLAMEIVGFFQG